MGREWEGSTFHWPIHEGVYFIQLTLGKNSKYILVLLTRAVETVDGYQLNSNTVVSNDDLFIR